MKIIIIEDEKLSAEHLELLLKRIEKVDSPIDSQIEIIAMFESVKECVNAFQNGLKCDLIFADIHLADGLSFEIFSIVNIDIPVIFTTAYDEYAIKAFKINSVDYLLKPIGKQDLIFALEKFNKLNPPNVNSLSENIQNIYNNFTKQFKNRFMVKIGDVLNSIKTEDANFFYADQGLVYLITDEKKYPIDYNLDQIESLVSPELFFRINRKVIININSIEKINSYFNGRLIINSDILDKEDCIVSRERVNNFKSWLDK